MCSSVFAEVWHKKCKHFEIYRFVREQDIVIHVILFMECTFVALNNERAFGSVLDIKDFKNCSGKEGVPVAYILLSFPSSLVSSTPPPPPSWFCWCVSCWIVTFFMPFHSFSNYKDLIDNLWWNSHPRLTKCK